MWTMAVSFWLIAAIYALLAPLHWFRNWLGLTIVFYNVFAGLLVAFAHTYGMFLITFGNVVVAVVMLKFVERRFVNERVSKETDS